jgi:glutamyl-tRNA(Gln) amidotransferase subunit E
LMDAFILVAARGATAERALEAVRERATIALRCVPREVRHAQPDDTTTYLRPLPGAARMYPETDVRPCTLTPEDWERIRAHLPERPEESEARLVKAHGLSSDIAKQIVAEGHLETFDAVTAQVDLPGELARLLLQVLPEIAGDGIDTRPLTPEAATALLAARAAGRDAKEAMTDVPRAYLQDPAGGTEQAIEKAGAGAMDEDAVRKVIDGIVAEKAELVKERGPGAMGPLMGVVMQELRGKADGALISKLLQEAIRKAA